MDIIDNNYTILNFVHKGRSSELNDNQMKVRVKSPYNINFNKKMSLELQEGNYLFVKVIQLNGTGDLFLSFSQEGNAQTLKVRNNHSGKACTLSIFNKSFVEFLKKEYNKNEDEFILTISNNT